VGNVSLGLVGRCTSVTHPALIHLSFEHTVRHDTQQHSFIGAEVSDSFDGVFAAGDVRQTSLRQVATAVGDGAIAGFEVERYIAELNVYQTQLIQSELPGMIYVYSPIDEPSRDFLPSVHEIECHYAGRVKLSLVDTYKGECLAARLGAVNTPSLVFTQDGKAWRRPTVLDPRAS
jgi:thioredoxin reductase (NADPH)